MNVRATYSKGVLRLLEPLPIADNTDVDVEVHVGRPVNLSPEGMDEIYSIMSERFDGGDPFVSERHNEHQP